MAVADLPATTTLKARAFKRDGRSDGQLDHTVKAATDLQSATGTYIETGHGESVVFDQRGDDKITTDGSDPTSVQRSTASLTFTTITPGKPGLQSGMIPVMCRATLRSCRPIGDFIDRFGNDHVTITGQPRPSSGSTTSYRADTDYTAQGRDLGTLVGMTYATGSGDLNCSVIAFESTAGPGPVRIVRTNTS
jgi:hypothetical protein